MNLGADSVITANGGSDGASSGGSIAIKSGGQFSDTTGSRIEARGVRAAVLVMEPLLPDSD